jgi:hypothetical protein
VWLLPCTGGSAIRLSATNAWRSAAVGDGGSVLAEYQVVCLLYDSPTLPKGATGKFKRGQEIWKGASTDSFAIHPPLPAGGVPCAPDPDCKLAASSVMAAKVSHMTQGTAHR